MNPFRVSKIFWERPGALYSLIKRVRGNPCRMPGIMYKKSIYHNGNHAVSNPSSDTFFILPVWFSKEFFQLPLLARDNEKTDQQNEQDGKCKGQ